MSGCRLPLLLTLVASLMGCASYTDETRDLRLLFRRDSYGQALKKLDDSSLKGERKNRLLYRLEKAMILDRMGEGTKARGLLVEADKIADELYTTSVTKTAASFLVNDAVMDYEGEDFERVAIHTQLALSFLADQNLAAARVEAVKINNKLQTITQKYDAGDVHYAEDAFARYLAGMIYEARGDIDDAIIDYGKALALYQGSYAGFVMGGVPDELVRALYRLVLRRNREDKRRSLEAAFPKLTESVREERGREDEGDVAVIHEIGHIATKSTAEFILPAGKQVVRFSFPVIRKHHHGYLGGQFVTDAATGQRGTAENVQDMDAIAHTCLEDRRGRMIAKEGARLIAKGALTEEVRRNFGELAAIAFNIFNVITETADTRSWTLLPEAYFISRIRVPAGSRTIRIESGGRLSRVETIKVPKGGLVILRDAA